MRLRSPPSLNPFLERPYGEELAVTALVCGDLERLKEMKDVADDDDGVLKVLDVHLHIESYVPPVFGIEENGAHLALMGPGRDVASAKYSAWPLDKLRPPLVTELLLSNYGDRILEGCITNFFVICQRDKNDAEGKYLHDYDGGYSIEVQTSPITDDVLPGVIRQLSMPEQGHPSAGRCTIMGKTGIWEEAFITNSLRVLRHVETIKVPHSWESFKSKCLNGILWMEKKFEVCDHSYSSIKRDHGESQRGKVPNKWVHITNNGISCVVRSFKASKTKSFHGATSIPKMTLLLASEHEMQDKNDVEGKYLHDYDNRYSVEVQTVPITDGVLHGIIRQLVIEVCMSKAIPVCEDAPSWEQHELWEDAFITNSLRVLQHVEMIKVPHSLESPESKCLNGISWMEKK
ncbi:hypothetical protein PTKIN_Ptkin16aG0478300 [Pterospermum kingtungense]